MAIQVLELKWNANVTKKEWFLCSNNSHQLFIYVIVHLRLVQCDSFNSNKYESKST